MPMAIPAPPAPGHPAPGHPAPVVESPLLSPPDSPFYTPASPQFSPDTPVYQCRTIRNSTPFNPPDIPSHSPFSGNATIYRSFSPDTGSENANDNHRYTPMGTPSWNPHYYYYPRSAPGPGAGPDHYAGLGSHHAPGPGAGRDDNRLPRIYRPIGSARPKAAARASHAAPLTGAGAGTHTNAVSAAPTAPGIEASGRASDPIDIRSPVEIDDHLARTMRAGHTPGPRLAPINFGNQGRIQEGGRLSPFVFGGNGPIVHQPNQERLRPAPFIFGGNIPANQEEEEQGQEQARPVPFNFRVDHDLASDLEADRRKHEKEMLLLRFKHERKLAIEKQEHERRMVRERQDHELKRLEAVNKLVNRVLQNERDQAEP